MVDLEAKKAVEIIVGCAQSPAGLAASREASRVWFRVRFWATKVRFHSNRVSADNAHLDALNHNFNNINFNWKSILKKTGKFAITPYITPHFWRKPSIEVFLVKNTCEHVCPQQMCYTWPPCCRVNGTRSSLYSLQMPKPLAVVPAPLPAWFQ